MNILITGGSGFIGSNLSTFHVKKGDHVTIIDNLITGRRENVHTIKNDVAFIESDITTYDFSSLHTFDVIYHLASPASPIQYKKYPIETLMTNALGTHRLLEFYRASESKRFVLASTSETYGDPLVHPQTEEYWGNVNPVGVRACYDEAKRFAEALTMATYRKYDLDIRIARIFNTYGPNMEQNDGRVVSNFIVQSLTNQPLTIYGDGLQTRSFCYVSDMVNGLYALGNTPNIKGSVINLGNPNEKTITELATLIKQITKTQSPIETRAIDEDDPKKRKPDISKANNLLQWSPTVSLEDGLQKTVDYFKTIVS